MVRLRKAEDAGKVIGGSPRFDTRHHTGPAHQQRTNSARTAHRQRTVEQSVFSFIKRMVEIILFVKENTDCSSVRCLCAVCALSVRCSVFVFPAAQGQACFKPLQPSKFERRAQGWQELSCGSGDLRKFPKVRATAACCAFPGRRGNARAVLWIRGLRKIPNG